MSLLLLIHPLSLWERVRVRVKYEKTATQ